jgi:murein DD-endopeptidase MepM/ murein hydrolase activator NlpD
MAGRGLLALAGATLPFASSAGAETIVRRVGRVTIQVDAARAHPGGLLDVRVSSTGRLGALWALLDGRRAPFFPSRGLARALVPVALTTEPGPATLGVGVAARRGEQRIAIPLTIASRSYPASDQVMPAGAAALLAGLDPGRDGRRLLAYLRVETREPAPGGLQPPVPGPGSGFGELRRFAGFANVESLYDGLAGEQHRGHEYLVPPRSPVRSPGAGTVVFAGPLAIPGLVVVIDHGQGVVSALLHLSRADVRVGEVLASGALLGLSGMSGLTSTPKLEWRTYLHGTAVDPRVLGELLASP